MRRIFAVVTVAALAVAGFAFAALPSGAGTSIPVVVPGSAGGPNNGGTDPVSTGIVLGPGKDVVLSASGTVTLAPSGGAPNGPLGGNPGNSTANSLVPSSPYGCLAYRVGSGSWSCLSSIPQVVSGTGELQFGINDDFVAPGVGYEDNAGQFDVLVLVPMVPVTITKTVTGANPGVAFPVTLTCTSDAELLRSVATDAEIVLDLIDTDAVTVDVPAGGSKTVEVWYQRSADLVACTAAESLATLPAGYSCTPSITPAGPVVLFDASSDEPQPTSVAFTVTNTCTGPPPPVVTQPTFTG